MSIADLITQEKHPWCLLNGKTVDLYVNGKIASDYRDGLTISFKEYTSDTILTILVKSEDISTKDIFTIDGDQYRVYKIEDVAVERGTTIYTEVLVYKDDFDRDVSIYRQGLGNDEGRYVGVIRDETAYIEGKARLNPVNQSTILEMPILGEGAPTHVITMPYTEDMESVKVGHAVECEGRWFEVIDKANHKERGVFTSLYTVERSDAIVKVVSKGEYDVRVQS